MTSTTDTVSADDYGTYVLTDNTSIVSGSGSHLFYIGGSFDTLTSHGDYETVVATGGDNTINLQGSGWNTVIMAGGNNVVNAGGGFNAILDAGGKDDTIVVPGAGKGIDIVVLLSGSDAKLDFRAALAATNWNGLASDLGSYISAKSASGVTTLSLSTTAHGPATEVASVASPGGTAWDVPTILTHIVA